LITTSSAATRPKDLTPGSFARATLAPGPNTVAIDVDAAGGYVGKLELKVAYQGEDGALRTYPAASIASAVNPGALGIGANATGSWIATVPGPGLVYVVATELASGEASVFLGVGPGGSLPAAGSGGSSLIPLMDYDDAGNVRYSGSAPSGSAPDDPAWRIARLDYDGEGNFTGYAYAGGGAYDQVWDDREELTYA
jgi:hypothetical protein